MAADAANAARIDTLIASAGRLRILTALAAEPTMEFVRLRSRTGLTDGNLCTHTRRLEAAGWVGVEKSFRERKPVTQVTLTPIGRLALEQHAKQLLDALSACDRSAREAEVTLVACEEPVIEDDWID